MPSLEFFQSDAFSFVHLAHAARNFTPPCGIVQGLVLQIAPKMKLLLIRQAINRALYLSQAHPSIFSLKLFQSIT